MPTETQHLEQRVAALQSDLNTKDEQIDALTFSDNDRELSRRSWFDEAKRLEKEVEALRNALEFYADREHYHFESGNWDTVSGEPLNILWCGDEPDFIEDGTVARNALSACAEPKCQDGGMCGDSSHKCTGCAPVERDLDDDPFFVQQAEPHKPAPKVERDERVEFEGFYLREVADSNDSLRKDHAGHYHNDTAMAAWSGWQARAALDKATEGASHE